MKAILITFVILSAARDLLVAQKAPPSADIYLVDLASHRATNITNRPGYDNQPSFTPDGRAILYTSTRDDGQSDIYRYDIAARTISRVTTTPESEYSATVMPGGTRFSVIRVEKDSTQRLWSFALDGSDPKLVIASLKPVGYHAWLDANTLAMFVLGSPNALVLGDLRTGKMDTVARGIGRSLAKLPDGSGFSFTQQTDTITLRAMDGARKIRDITMLHRGVQDIVWLSDGSLVVGRGSKLLQLPKDGQWWIQLADLTADGVTEITRLAVSPDGKWLAIVAVPK